MEWDAVALTESQEAALAAVEQSYSLVLHQEGPPAGNNRGGQPDPQLPAPPVPGPAAAPPARKRRLPDLKRKCPGPDCQALPHEPSADENLAPAQFPGRLHYVFSAPDVERCCQWLLKDSRVAVLGFDIEWRVTYQTGVSPRPVALLQLCYQAQGAPPPQQQRPQQQRQQRSGSPKHEHYVCLLLHICHSGITPSLQQLLCTQDILKVGIGVVGDAHKVQRDLGLQMGGVLCLSELANARLSMAAASGAARTCIGSASLDSDVRPAGTAADSVPPTCAAGLSGSTSGQMPQQGGVEGAPQRWSLAGLVRRLLRLSLNKEQGLRCSNWEVRPPLSTEQQRYAATDAWAALRVYEVLSGMPVLMPTTLTGPHHAATPAAPAPAAGLAAAPLQPADAASWVPACAVLGHLQPAKQAVYRTVVQQGLTVAQVAAQRHIREDSVRGYLAEATTAGYSYTPAALGLSEDVLRQVSGVCGSLLGCQLAWHQGGGDHRHAGHRLEEPVMQRDTGVGSKRPAPCSPPTLAAAAVAAEAAQQENAQHEAVCEAVAVEARVDLLQQLLDAGYKLRELKEERLPEVGYGQLKLALAHLGRMQAATVCVATCAELQPSCIALLTGQV